MREKKILFAAILWCLLLAFASVSSWAQAPASLPKATQQILKKLKLAPSILAGLDQELEVPGSWIDGARKEGKLKILSTFDPPQAAVLLAPFQERYPFIRVQYDRGSYEGRVIKTVVAFKEGRYVTDVVTGIGGSVDMFSEADALADLRVLPNWRNDPEWAKDGKGLWAGMHLRYWCMAYNKKLVKKSDLPKKWEDLLTNPIWRNRNLALGNRPELWPLMLWKAWGERKAKDFFTRLFRDVKPQLRKEGMNAMVELLGAGEFYASIPSAGYRTSQKESEGAPVSFACAEPVPVMTSEMGILKGAPDENSAKLFVNWFLSKEGQLAQYLSDRSPPVHRGMQRKEFLPYADEILGKPTSVRMPEDAKKTLPKVRAFWNGLWLGKGAGKRS